MADSIIKPTDGELSTSRRLARNNLRTNAKEDAKAVLKEKPIKINTKNAKAEKDIDKTR